MLAPLLFCIWFDSWTKEVKYIIHYMLVFPLIWAVSSLVPHLPISGKYLIFMLAYPVFAQHYNSLIQMIWILNK